MVAHNGRNWRFVPLLLRSGTVTRSVLLGRDPRQPFCIIDSSNTHHYLSTSENLPQQPLYTNTPHNHTLALSPDIRLSESRRAVQQTINRQTRQDTTRANNRKQHHNNKLQTKMMHPSPTNTTNSIIIVFLLHPCATKLLSLSLYLSFYLYSSRYLSI